MRKGIYCIVQDKDGLLWVGSERNGLFCYDGNDLKKIKISEEQSFKTVYSIFIDREGVIWFFMEGEGLYSFDKEKGVFKKYAAEKGNRYSLTCNSAQWLPCNITEDKEGLIWVGTIDGLNCYNKRTGKFAQHKHNKEHPNSISNNVIWSVFVDRDGLIWIGTEAGLNCYDKNTNSFYCYKHNPEDPNSLSDNRIRAIAEDRNGSIWIGTKESGLDKLEKKTGKFTNYRHDPKNKMN